MSLCINILLAVKVNFLTFASMKRLLPIAFALFFMIVSCNRYAKYEAMLYPIESISASRPDSALRLYEALAPQMEGAPERVRMYYDMMITKNMVNSGAQFTSDSMIRAVADFYDSHGEDSHRMLSRCLLGCVNLRMGNTPEALFNLESAAGCADTTAADCDYHLLGQVYALLAHTYLEAMLPRNVLEASRLCYRYAMKAGDTLVALSGFDYMANAYISLGMPDSAIAITEKSSRRFRESGYSEASAISTAKLIEIYIDRDEPEKASRCMAVFDRYSRVLDKNGEGDILAVQEKQMNNMLLLEAEIEGEYMYEEVARYALQKLLIAGYEIRIADRAGLTGAADSLNSLTPPTSHIDDYFLPVLDTRERMFYDFADAQIVRPAKYANINQVPQVEIFPRGSMYRILLGAFSRRQPVSVFRSVYPLSQETKADRKHYYYAGGYATYAEAEEAAARLKRQGFRNPRVVAWHDGLYDAAPGAESGSAVTEPSGQTTRIRYRVEIGGAGESLSRVVRDVISTQAAGKVVSRTADPETGEPLFVVGSFNNKTLAEARVQDIDPVEPGLTIRLVAVQ